MPIRNEEVFIARSLGAVLNQDYPAELLEVLVADGASEDRTVAIIKALPDAGRVRIIPNPGRTQSCGLNAAIRQAKGQVIVRVDGHTVIAPDYVRQCLAALLETGADNVGGPMEPLGITTTGKAIACASKSAFAVPSAFHISTHCQYADTVYLGAWPRQVLERLGGFDERLRANEDYELNYRIRKAEGKIYLSLAIRSCYFGRQTFPALARQYFHYGKAKTTTLRKYPTSVRPRHLVAPCFVLALICASALATTTLPTGKVWLLLLITYLSANLLCSIRVAWRAGWVLLWWIPLVFLTIHLAWGLGFWVGLMTGNRIRLHRQGTYAQ